MLDVFDPSARFISRGGGTYDHTHTNLADVSIYSDLAKIRRVPIDALTHTQIHDYPRSCPVLRSVRSASESSSGLVIFRLVASPSTTATSCPARSTAPASSVKSERRVPANASSMRSLAKACGV